MSQGGPKCDHKCPDKREVTGENTVPQGRRRHHDPGGSESLEDAGL